MVLPVGSIRKLEYEQSLRLFFDTSFGLLVEFLEPWLHPIVMEKRQTL